MRKVGVEVLGDAVISRVFCSQAATTCLADHPLLPTLALGPWPSGLDTCLSIMKVLQQQFGDSKYRPCPLLAQVRQRGHGPFLFVPYPLCMFSASGAMLLGTACARIVSNG